MKNFYTIIFIFFVSIIGCTNQNEEDFFSDDDCDLENISYLSVVQEIIESKCIACHAQGNMNGPVLDNHENVVKYIDDILFLITDLENIRIIRPSAVDTNMRVRRFNLVEYFLVYLINFIPSQHNFIFVH